MGGITGRPLEIYAAASCGFNSTPDENITSHISLEDQLHELDLYVRDNRSEEILKNSLDVLDEMEDEVRQVEVPLSYAEELYHLRLHIDLLRNQLSRRVG